MAASDPVGQDAVPSVEVAPSALRVMSFAPLPPGVALVSVAVGRTGLPLSSTSWKVPVHGLAKLFSAPAAPLLLLALACRSSGPVLVTVPTNESLGMPGPETRRPVSSALIFGSKMMLDPGLYEAGSLAAPGEPLTFGLSPVRPVGRSMKPAAPGPGWSWTPELLVTSGSLGPVGSVGLFCTRP